MFKCEICGKEYDNLRERSTCELSCIRKKEEKERREQEKLLAEQKEARYVEVKKAYDEYLLLLKKYREDYPVTSISMGRPYDMIWNLFER